MDEPLWQNTPEARAIHAAIAERGFEYLTHRQVDAILHGLSEGGFLYRQAIADLRDAAARPAPVAGWQGLYRAADFLESRITEESRGA